jgi:hypothetical protein
MCQRSLTLYFTLCHIHLVKYRGHSGVILQSITPKSPVMAAELLRTLGNRVATDEEALVLQEQLKEENALVEHLKRGQELQVARLQTEERIVGALSRSRDSTEVLLQATNQLVDSIEQLWDAFNASLPDQEDPDVAPRLPPTENYVSEWRFALEALAGVSDLVLQRAGDAGERSSALQAELQLHESLRAHAAQAAEHIDTSLNTIYQSIDDKRLGVLHPMRRLAVEIFREIFQYAVEEEHHNLMNQFTSNELPAQMHLPTVAFTIAATCRHWREIATAMPKLWRYICAPWIAPVQLDGRVLSAIVGRARFERCLALAGNTNLELTVRGQKLSCWEPILENEDTRRWTWINILDAVSTLSFLPPAPNVFLCSSYTPNSTLALPPANSLVSSVRYLTCRSCLPRVNMQIAGLSQLDIWLANKQVICPDLGALLTSLPTLSMLSLDCADDIEFQFHGIGNRTTRSHRSLRSLGIMTCFAQYIASELQSISLPSLTELKILNLHTFFNSSQVTRLLTSPITSTVTSLSVQCTEYTAQREEIRSLIGGFPKLTRLTLDKFAILPGLEALLGTSVAGQLEEITLGSHGEEKVNELVAGLRSTSPRINIRTL